MASLDYLSSRILVPHTKNQDHSPVSRQSQRFTATFAELSREIDDINFTVYPEDIASEKLEKAKVKVGTALTDFYAFITRPDQNGADFDLLYSVASFADKFKKKNFENHNIWNSLNNPQKALLDCLAPVYSHPDEDYTLFIPDIGVITPNNSYNFGDGALIATSNFTRGPILWFDLRHHPDLKLAKPCVPLRTEVSLVEDDKLVQTNLGRLGELFDLDRLEKCLQVDAAYYDLTNSKDLLIAQLQEMYRFYWQSIIEIFGLPVAKPVAVSCDGEWFIKPKVLLTKPLSEVDFQGMPPAAIRKIAENIHTHLFVELQHNINILGLLDSIDVFGVTANGRCVVDMLKPLPGFFEISYIGLEKRHLTFLKLLESIPVLHSHVNELYHKSLGIVAQQKAIILVLAEFEGPRIPIHSNDLLRAHLMDLYKGREHLAQVSEEEVILYTQFYLDFLKSKSSPAPTDEAFNLSIIHAHQELEAKLHNRILVHLCQRIPKTDHWQELIRSIQDDAEKLFKKLEQTMKQKLVPLRSDGWKSIEEQLKVQIAAPFLERLEGSLKEFLEKINENHFTREKLLLFAAQSEQIHLLQSKSNLNKDLMALLHDVMQQKEKEVFVRSLKEHLKTLRS